MASGLMTGLTASSYQRYIRGPGKVYKDFVSYPDNPGTELGATLGGAEFNWGIENYDIVPDGSLGLIKNHRLISMCKPTLKVNLLEATANNLIYSIAGDSDDQTPTDIKGEYLGTGTALTVGVVLQQGTTGGAVDESTLQVWYTAVGLDDVDKGVLDTDYQVVDQITMASVTTGDTVVIGGLTFTGHADTTTVADREFDASGDDTADAVELISCINDATYGVPGVTATSALGVVSLTRATAGTPNTITQTGDTMTMEYQVVQEVVAGSIVDTDLVTASYTYDSTDSGDAYTVITPGQFADGDYWTNIALVCELSNQSYSNPYFYMIVKNALPEPDAISIPAQQAGEAAIAVTFSGFFDPSDGLTLANAPVEVGIGIS